jgi:hypothetical protein
MFSNKKAYRYAFFSSKKVRVFKFRGEKYDIIKYYHSCDFDYDQLKNDLLA